MRKADMSEGRARGMLSIRYGLPALDPVTSLLSIRYKYSLYSRDLGRLK